MKPVLTVSEITQVVKNLIEGSEILRQVFVRGEISNFKHHSSGHMYFTLKDEKSQLRSIMFRSRSMLLPFVPENGMKVIAFGYVSVFTKSGEYQLYVEDIEPDGIGALHFAFEKLKTKLEYEGLFDDKNKMPLPFLPRKIGIVTSITGAALRDILTVIKRRYYNIDIVIAPVLVQGEGAPDVICSAIGDLNQFGDLDVIIVGRGGGSIEELWAFNDERVARAIFSSKIPVISAVGHETDFTIADFVADKRAPTPSAAGEIVVPEKISLINGIAQLEYRMVNAMRSFVALRRQRLEYAKKTSAFTRPEGITASYKVMIDQWVDRLHKEIRYQMEGHRSTIRGSISKLNALNPLAVLERGFSIAMAINGQIIRKIDDAHEGDALKLIVTDGTLICEVKGCEGKVTDGG